MIQLVACSPFVGSRVLVSVSALPTGVCKSVWRHLHGREGIKKRREGPVFYVT